MASPSDAPYFRTPLRAVAEPWSGGPGIFWSVGRLPLFAARPRPARAAAGFPLPRLRVLPALRPARRPGLPRRAPRPRAGVEPPAPRPAGAVRVGREGVSGRASRDRQAA